MYNFFQLFAAWLEKIGREDLHTKSAIRSNTQHIGFWDEAIQVFRSMKFINSKKQEIVPPSVKNWIFTLKSLKYLWQTIEKEQIKFLCPRNLNQDPLEFFLDVLEAMEPEMSIQQEPLLSSLSNPL